MLNKKTIDFILKNNKNISLAQIKEGGKNPIITNDPDIFIKGMKEDFGTHHIFIRQDPITNLYGAIYTSKNDKQPCYFSPNSSRMTELENTKKWMTDNGLIGGTTGKEMITWGDGFNNKYNNTDIDFSALWVIGFITIWAEAWSKEPPTKTSWDDLTNDSKWKPVAEAEKAKYYNYLEESQEKNKDCEQIKQDLATAKTAQATAEASLKEYKEKLGTETPEQLKSKLSTLEADKTKAEQERDTAKTTISDLQHTIKDKEKIIDETKDLPDKLTELGKQLTDKDEELKKRTDEIATLTNEKATLEKELNPIKDYWEKNFKYLGGLSVENLTKIDKQLDIMLEANRQWVSGFKEFSSVMNSEGLQAVRQKLKDNDAEIKKLKEQQTTQSDYLNKLLANYKREITKITKRFYLNDLGIDESDDIRPKYENKIIELGKDPKLNENNYLVLLDNLKGESEPEQVINAFKLVALICATEKAQGTSNKWINNPLAKKPQIKEPKLKYFNNILKFWNLNINLLPTEENNPLWLPIINQKNEYKKQINEIIKLWQTL